MSDRLLAPDFPAGFGEDVLRHAHSVAHHGHTRINRALDLPGVQAQMDQPNTDGARTATPEAFAAMFKSEYARFARLVKEAGIKIE